MKLYTIFFLGEPTETVTIDELKINLMRLFKTDEAGVEKLFTGKPVIIKKNLPEDKAKSYQTALTKAGAKVVLKDVTPVEEKKPKSFLSSALSKLTGYNDDKSGPEPEPELAQGSGVQTQLVPNGIDDKNTGLTMLPANTGSLEEFNHHDAEVDIPDIQHLQAEKGSLEEFSRDDTPINIPDTSSLHCINNDELNINQKSKKKKDKKDKKKKKKIDIGHLSMSEANSGSLEEFAKHESVSIPDISHLKAEEN